MPLYNYVAMDSQGNEKKGKIEGENENGVSSTLKNMGLFPTEIKQANSKNKKTAKTALSSDGIKKKKSWKDMQIGAAKIPGKELVIFTRQLAILLDAGLPLIRALRTLERQAKNKVSKKIIGETADYVESGFTFSESLSKNKSTFDYLYVNMIKAGESAGALEIILGRLATFMEKTAKIINKIKTAMIYPLVVIVVAGGVTVFLMTFIVPRFKVIFSELLQGTPLPELTIFVINLSDVLVNKIWSIVIVVVLIVVIFKVIKKTKKGAYLIDLAKYKMPLLGSLVSKTSIARFTRTLGTLLSSGVPVLNALLIVRDTSGNELVKVGIQKVHDAVKEGDTIASPLLAAKIFPDMVISMIEVGEETGKLPEMLEKIADTYEEEVDNAVEALTSLIEPIMIVFMAVVVGTIVIAMFMPLIKIMQTLGA